MEFEQEIKQNMRTMADEFIKDLFEATEYRGKAKLDPLFAADAC